jgi:hypothetical protein
MKIFFKPKNDYYLGTGFLSSWVGSYDINYECEYWNFFWEHHACGCWDIILFFPTNFGGKS